MIQDQPGEPYWAVAQTIAEREDAVAERLDRAGFETLAPKARFRVAGQMRVMALFPGYVFLRVIDHWYDARWTIGVTRLIMAGEHPAHLPPYEIEKIQNDTQRNGLVRLPKLPRVPPRTLITEGSTVRILTGSFIGLHAIFQGTSARERIIVLLDLLGQRRFRVELNAEDRIEASPSLASENGFGY
jgi:transcription antitermination factor NusG